MWKRKTYKKKTYRPKKWTGKTSRKTFAKKVYKVMKKKSEAKLVHNQYGALGTIGADQQTTINGISEGPGCSQRIGKEVTFKYLQVRGAIQLSPSQNGFTALPDLKYRIICLLYKQNDGSSSNIPIATFLENTDNTLEAFQSLKRTTFPTSGANPQKGITILKDFVVSYKSPGVVDPRDYSKITVHIPFQFTKKLNFKTIFKGTGGSAGDITNNRILVYMIPNQVTGSFTYWSQYFGFEWVLKYDDF